jgi:AAA family ATP:ADP antiporter
MTPAPRQLRLLRILAQTADIDRREMAALVWSFVYFFCVLCSYYILRPLRDEMGVTVGRDGLQWLFVAVFVVMVAAVPLFGWVVSSFERRRVAPLIYAFFIINLVGFWLVLESSGGGLQVASGFFVWVSVFNLFVVSLFWSVMSDLWTSEQAKRLYGFIAAGGSAGAITGPVITQSLVHTLGSANLLLISAALLLGAVTCIIALGHAVQSRQQQVERPEASGGLLAGASHVVRSPYLRRIAFWVLMANLISTFFYFEQARLVGAAISDRADRVQLFARMDLAVNLLTVLGQVFVAGRLMQFAGVGISAALFPASAAVGLIVLASFPTLAVIVTIIVVERAFAFAIANPAMRVLYTVVSPEDKYKAQNFVDTVVFRGGDAASGWIFNTGAKALGAPAWAVAILILPLTLVWLGLTLALGREQAARAEKAGQTDRSQ